MKSLNFSITSISFIDKDKVTLFSECEMYPSVANHPNQYCTLGSLIFSNGLCFTIRFLFLKSGYSIPKI